MREAAVYVPKDPIELARVPDEATVIVTGQTQGPIHDQVARAIGVAQLPTDGRPRLLAILGWARRRVAAAMPAGPEWEAAAAGVDAYELELDGLDLGASHPKVARRPSGATTTLDFGPVTLPDAVTIRGAIIGRDDRARAMRQKMRGLAVRATTRRWFMRELERVATQVSFVVEMGAVESTSVTFYAWDNQPPEMPT
jgi:hypothetical protein